MGAYLVRRLLLMLVTLFGMSVLIFVMLRLVPGNITDIIFDSAGFVNPAAKEENRAPARPRPADRHPVRQLDRRPGARRPRLRLRLGKARHRGDPAAHPGHGQARSAGAGLLDAVRRAARRGERGAPEYGARLCAAGRESERAIAAVLLARPAHPDGVRALVRLDSDLQEQHRQFLARPGAAEYSRPPPLASAARRWSCA